MLNAHDFESFYEALHGRPAFPWQIALAQAIIERGRWPDLLDLPTGAGKTSALDIALFAMAVQPETFPRRVLLVIDRRVVVDQGALHAKKVLARLCDAREGVLFDFAQRLRSMWGGELHQAPFAVAVLRGGMPRDDAWSKRPDQPVLAVSTVDQVGSRLLFRGYGVSHGMQPVHAGLMGEDALILLDEVHLAVPFAQTLRAISERWRVFRERSLPNRWGVVRMSATAGAVAASDWVFGLDQGPVPDRTHPALAMRLAARKPVRLEEVQVKGSEDQRKERIAETAVAEAKKLLEGGAKTVAVVVNRVDTARRAHAALAKEAKIDTILLTGRMRPLDRDRVMGEQLSARICSGRSRSAADQSLIVVATQCIEAGADFDFDGLVSECASLDALRQRFGRVDRLGQLPTPGAEVFRGVILMRTDFVDKDSDPVYGASLPACWQWLTGLEAVDFGNDALPRPPEDIEPTLLAPSEDAPILVPAQLDAWCQTQPQPSPCPDPELWLHGPQRRVDDVQLVWRADIHPKDAEREDAESYCSALLSACPPGSLEALSVPISAVRAWLKKTATPELSDVPMIEDAPIERGESAVQRPILHWDGEHARWLKAADIIPGMTLVAPSEYGGVGTFNWDPDALEAVRDYGDLVQWRLRGKASLRLRLDVLASALGLTGLALPPTANFDELEEPNLDADIAAFLTHLAASQPAQPFDEMLAQLRKGHRRIELPDGSFTLVGRKRLAGHAVDFVSGSDGQSFIEREVSLKDHTADVRKTVQSFAKALGLPADLSDDLCLAAELHDLGKADPRFQLMLLGGNEVRLAGIIEPIAKSAQSSRDGVSRELARLRSKYPLGYRHELLSVALVQSAPALLDIAHDPELVLHLITSHHGRCRPFAPVAIDDAPVDVELEQRGRRLSANTEHGLERLGSGVAERFWNLNERYGWWGLAWIETILRLADHRASEEEERG